MTETSRKIKLITNNKNGTLLIPIPQQLLTRFGIKKGDFVNKAENSLAKEIQFFLAEPPENAEWKSKVIQKNQKSFYLSIPAKLAKKYHLQKQQIVQLCDNFKTGVITLRWGFMKRIAEMTEDEILQRQDEFAAEIMQYIEAEKGSATVEKIAAAINPSDCPNQKRLLEMTIQDLRALHKIHIDPESRVISKPQK
jgi:hypothetical protein